MKYPQLVSPKAISVISDWLITELEILDIEHPLVYARLLLSLLHPPLKVNAIDLYEDLKKPYRLLNKNNEELKRMNAVESLMELSAEENKSYIINLVDVLHSKLKKLENGGDEIAMNFRSSNSASSSPIAVSSSLSVNSKLNKNLKQIKRSHGAENSTKNYYLAFPPLNNNKMAVSSKTATLTSADKQLFKGHEDGKNEANFQLLSWSKLMSKASAPLAKVSSQELKIEKLNRNKNPQIRRKEKSVEKKCSIGSSKVPIVIDMSLPAKYLALKENFPVPSKRVQTASANTDSNKKAKPQRQHMHSKRRLFEDEKSDTTIQYNNHSGIAQNDDAPKQDESGVLWDMDFKGPWEMEIDLVGDFKQKQANKGKMKIKHAAKSSSKKEESSACYPLEEEEDEEAMLMKCLPTKLIEESLVDAKIDPFRLKESLSITSLKSKFDDNVIKAIWNDCGNEPAKPSTHSNFFDNGKNASLASTFINEKNSLSLFNFCEPQPISSQYYHQMKNFIEANAPPTMYTEMAPVSSYANAYAYADNNNNNNNNNDISNNFNASFFNGSRDANPMSDSFDVSPFTQQCDLLELCKFDFIGSGTNLPASIWAEGNFANKSECLILRDDVVETNNIDEVGGDICSGGTDEVVNTLDQLNSLGNHMKDWHSYNDEDDEEVSLINHSAEQSAFRKYKPVVVPTVIRASYHPLSTGYARQEVKAIPPEEEDEEEQENYMTSEKYHFSPIIHDGHTFAVDNNWEQIQYDKTPGGGRYQNNKRYQVWKKPDELIWNGKFDVDAMENEACGSEDKALEIKYLVKQDNEKSSQTENDHLIRLNRSFLEINEEYCRRRIYDEYVRGVTETNKWRCLNSNVHDESNDYSFFSVNRKGKNTDESTPKPCPDFLPFQDILSQDIIAPQEKLPSSTSSSSSICTITSKYDAAAVEDPFEAWRNFNAVQDHKHNCEHRLWEQCIKCARNDEDLFIEKPVPANRLLKDELNFDGDEIMNVIQNLNIASDLCEDEEEKDEECDGVIINRVMSIFAMDDGMDELEEDEEDKKFYEENDNNNNQKESLEKSMNNFNLYNSLALAKMQSEIEEDQEKPEKFFELLSALAQNNITTGTMTADMNNNNDCRTLSEIHRTSKNRKRRHSTCQNYLEKRRFDSQEPGLAYHHLNRDSVLTPTGENTAENFFLDPAKMYKLLFLDDPIANPIHAFLKTAEIVENPCNFNYNNYHRLIQQQLDLSRPLTR